MRHDSSSKFGLDPLFLVSYGAGVSILIHVVVQRANVYYNYSYFVLCFWDVYCNFCKMHK